MQSIKLQQLVKSVQLLTRSSSRIISAMPGLISQSSVLVLGSNEAIVIGSIDPPADKNDGNVTGVCDLLLQTNHRNFVIHTSKMHHEAIDFSVELILKSKSNVVCITLMRLM